MKLKGRIFILLPCLLFFRLSLAHNCADAEVSLYRKIARSHDSPEKLHWSNRQTPKSLDELVKEHRLRIAAGTTIKPVSKKLKFVGPGLEGKNFYNPTEEFTASLEPGLPPQKMIGVRVEDPKIETGSEVLFFSKHADGDYHLIPDAQQFKPIGPYVALQDPTYAKIKGENILSMVEVFEQLDKDGKKIPGLPLGYRTVFYRDRGRGINFLQRFAIGPPKHKDVRLLELSNGQIQVITRPQGLGNPGKIGAIRIDQLADLTPEVIASAPILKVKFVNKEWGGANKLSLVVNHKGEDIVVIQGHVASFDIRSPTALAKEETPRNYAGGHFGYNPKTGETTEWKVVLERRDLENGMNGGFKEGRPDLNNVTFMGGGTPEKLTDETMPVMVGAGDSQTHRVVIENFLREYY